jgi:uncharacterized protein (DUF983 family)
MRYHPAPAPAPREPDHVRGEHVANCPGCDRRQAWTGLLHHRPACACGHRCDPAELLRDQIELDRLLAAPVTP